MFILAMIGLVTVLAYGGLTVAVLVALLAAAAASRVQR